MRLRNIPRAEGVLRASSLVVKDETSFCGQWREQVFHNPAPIHIEIGMGKGQFLTTLARKHTDINYIGIERYSSVLLRAVERLEGMETDGAGKNLPEKGLPADNLRFICMDAASIVDVFAEGEVDRIYLNFSDPWPKARHARRRLTSLEYLERYGRILSTGGQIEFKTDNRDLFDFSVAQVRETDKWELAACTYNLHQDTDLNKENVMTEYEEKFSAMGNAICKLTAVRGVEDRR